MTKIVAAEEKHLDSVFEVAKTPELMTAEGTYIPRHFFAAHIGSPLFLVAEDDDNVVGFILAEGLKGGIVTMHFLAVRNEHRGKGIGKKLILELEKKIKAEKRHYMFFQAPTFNQKTVDFYSKLGYAKGKAYYTFSKEFK